MMTASTHKFRVGSIVATPAAMERLTQREVLTLLDRHASGDWGDVCEEDKRANDQALGNEGRLLSAYTIRGTKLWLITEADRSSTCILLPEEY